MYVYDFRAYIVCLMKGCFFLPLSLPPSLLPSLSCSLTHTHIVDLDIPWCFAAGKRVLLPTLGVPLRPGQYTLQAVALILHKSKSCSQALRSTV